VPIGHKDSDAECERLTLTKKGMKESACQTRND
jgi:hypothetical protein